MEKYCECINWCRDGIGAPYNIRRRDGIILMTNHHPRCSHYDDSLMDVWKVIIGGSRCYVETEQDAKDMAGQEAIEGGEAVITEEKMHREIFENLPEFQGF